jgi:hypothetical protein
LNLDEWDGIQADLNPGICLAKLEAMDVRRRKTTPDSFRFIDLLTRSTNAKKTKIVRRSLV